MTELMQWEKLLTRKRLGKHISEEQTEKTRTCFQQDYDRLVFSSPFRRLKDKTQVFPLSKHDYVRTRLIHSLEVSCVGRSLGSLVGRRIKENDLLAGTFDTDLISLSRYADCLKEIKNKTRDKVFRNPEIVKIEIAGYEVINYLFDKFVNSFLEENQQKSRFENILPIKYRPKKGDSLYSNIMRITDYISGMTDTYATELFQQLHGISLN